MPRAVTAVAWLLSAPLAGWAVMRTFGLERGYPLVPLVSYTPYVFLAGLVLLVLLAASDQRGALALAGVAVIVLGLAVVPRALPRPAPDDSGRDTLTVLSANVLKGRSKPSRIVDLVRDHDVDVLSVQELTPGFVAALRDAGLPELLPHRVLAAGPGTTGTGLYSRLPLTELAPVDGTAHTQTRAQLAWAGRPIELVSVHPPPPMRRLLDDWRRGLRGLPPANGARLLAGDFNATLDHAELRRLIASGYADAAARRGAGWRRTWHANRRAPGVVIDHVLVDDAWQVHDYEVFEIPPSDHKAVLAEIDVSGGA